MAVLSPLSTARVLEVLPLTVEHASGGTLVVSCSAEHALEAFLLTGGHGVCYGEADYVPPPINRNSDRSLGTQVWERSSVSSRGRELA